MNDKQTDHDIVKIKFEQKKEIAGARKHALFDVFERELGKEEEETLKFVYAYMPINDLGDCSGDFFLDHIREITDIRKKMPWGAGLPEYLFKHFVLPYRINNENIEEYTGILHNELYDRVKGLSMYDAVLEVNHWCFEKATYIGCDPRTSSPLSVIRRAIGRCGEETVLAVAALRSVCIPARQCYTPKWVHCDSNHAWAEAWADGRWHYFGACEPEARLNSGWFKDPARRAMLINSRVPANYTGPEEVTLAHEWYTELNLLENYAPNKKITVKVTDMKGDPSAGAAVHFQAYNYGDFLSIAILTTDKEGCVSLMTGYGDVLLHVVAGDDWCSRRIDVREGDMFELTVSDVPPVSGAAEFDMVPPLQTYAETEGPMQAEVEKNNARLKTDTDIRKAYEATFINRERSDDLAVGLSLPCEILWNVLEKARGNSHEIASFLKETVPEYGETALDLLTSLLDKDLTDTFRPVLKDHLYNSVRSIPLFDKDIFIRYILCPRVGHEMIGPYRSVFQEYFSADDQAIFRQDPQKLVEWVKRNIKILEGYSYFQGPASPKGSLGLRTADKLSRNILFVAIARSLGIPSRLESADKRPQFLHKQEWMDAGFETAVKVKKIIPGRIRLTREPDSSDKAEYGINFTLSRFDDRFFRTLDYKKIDFSEFEKSVEALPGIYRLVSGARTNDGTALVRTIAFSVVSGKECVICLKFRKEEQRVPVLGTVTEACSFKFIERARGTPIRELSERDLLAVWTDPDREPSKHLLRELRELSSEFDLLGCRVILCVGDDKLTSSFGLKLKEGLPKNTDIGIDTGYSSLRSLTSGIKDPVTSDLPLVYIIDRNLGIRYESHGYKPGRGTEALKVMTAVRKSFNE